MYTGGTETVREANTILAPVVQRVDSVTHWIRYYPVDKNCRENKDKTKIKFVSTRGHVIFCLLYKQQHQGYFSNFPKISANFPKISEDLCKFSEQCPKFIRTFPIIFRKFPKMSEDFRRLPKVAECFRAIVEDVSIT